MKRIVSSLRCLGWFLPARRTRSAEIDTARARTSQGGRRAADAGAGQPSVQSTIGLATGTAIYGLAFGGIFALVFAGVYGRIGRANPRMTAALLATMAEVLDDDCPTDNKPISESFPLSSRKPLQMKGYIPPTGFEPKA
jgi:hypothetical protein